MRWDDLQILQAVGSTGSYTLAANRLGISHSTISRRLRALEAMHGIRLIQPKGQGIELTISGQALYEATARMADEADVAIMRLSGIDPVLRGVIRLATTDMMALMLMPRLREFTAAHPEMTIETVIGEQLSSLTKNEADIVLRQTVSPPKDYFGPKVATTHDAVFGSVSLCSGKDDATALTEVPWVSYADDWGGDWRRRHAPRALVAARIDSELGVVEAVRAGIGIGHVRVGIGDTDPTLRRLTPDLPELDLDIWVLIHRENRQSTRLRRFMEFLQRIVPEQLADWTAPPHSAGQIEAYQI